MNNLNSVLLEGNLVRDPECFQLTEGTCMTRFSIGVNRYYLNRQKEYVEEASFFTIITWGKTAEICGKLLKKGRGVRVLGRLRQERWVAKDGDAKDRIIVVAEHVEFQAEKKERDSAHIVQDPKPVPPIDIDPSIEINPPDSESEALDSMQEEIAIEADQNQAQAPF